MMAWLRLMVLMVAGCSQAVAGVTFDASSVGDLPSEVADYRAKDDLPDQLTRISLSRQIQVEPDQVRLKVRELWYYATAADVQNYGTDRIYFNDQLDSVNIMTAASVDSSGQLHRFDPNTLKVTDVDRNDTFTDSRQAVIALPGLGAGSISMLEYEIVSDRSQMALDWSDVLYEQASFPSERVLFDVVWSDSDELSWSSDTAWMTCREGDRSLTCEGRQIPAIDSDNITNYRDDIGQVVIAESQSWDTVVDRARNAYGKAFDDTRGADDILSELKENTDDTAGQIAEIHRFVAQAIRYVSMSEKGHAITPHTVSSVVLSRYGDCKDKSALLQYLLQEIGVEAYPVLVATDRTDASKLSVPSMGYFDHMVVCFDWQGQTRCLDATDSYTDWRHTPAWIQGRVALQLQESSSPTVIEPSTFRWRLRVDSDLVLKPDGSAREAQTRTYVGEYAGSMRGLLASMNPDAREQWAVENYHQEVSDLATPSFQFEGVEQLIPELTIRSRADYPPYVDPGVPLKYFEYSAWVVDELESLHLAETGMATDFPGLEVITEHAFDLGQAWQLSIPAANLKLKHEYGSLVRNIERVNTHLFAARTKLVVPQQTLRGDEIPEFNRFLGTLAQQSAFEFNGKLN